MIGGSHFWVRTIDDSAIAPSAAEYGTVHFGAVAIGVEQNVLLLRYPHL